MKEIVTEELLKKIDNRFLLSIVAAKRARQLKEGAVSLVDRTTDDNDLIVSLAEIMDDKIKAELGAPTEASDDSIKLIENIKKTKKEK